MTRPPTLADWQRDPACIDRYLAGLDTLEVIDMGEGTLRCLSDFLFDAARKKVLSSISLSAPSVRSCVAAEAKALDAVRQHFLAEAALFETAGRFFRAESNRRLASDPFPETNTGPDMAAPSGAGSPSDPKGGLL